MRNTTPICLLSIILLITGIIGCGGNAKLVKKQGEASRNLGEAYMATENYTAALREFLKAEELTPDDPYLQNDLGMVYMAKEKFDIAITHFKKALALNPNYAPARNNMGTAYLAQKNWDAAIATFKEVSQDILYATPHYPLSNLGWAYYNKGNYELAANYYKEALKIDPNFIVALRGLGRAHLAMGKVNDAIQTLDKAIEKAPRVPELYYDLAHAYMVQRNEKKALDAFRKVVAVSPENSELAEEAQKQVLQLTNRRSGQ